MRIRARSSAPHSSRMLCPERKKPLGIDRVRLGIAKIHVQIRLSKRPGCDGEATLIGDMQSDVDQFLDEVAGVVDHRDRRGLMSSPETATEEMGQTVSGQEERRKAILRVSSPRRGVEHHST